MSHTSVLYWVNPVISWLFLWPIESCGWDSQAELLTFFSFFPIHYGRRGLLANSKERPRNSVGTLIEQIFELKKTILFFHWSHIRLTTYVFLHLCNGKLMPYPVVCFILISNMLPNLISDLISDFGIASMLNHTINLDFGNKIYGIINMEAIPKFDIKSDIKFDISIKGTTWIGHKADESGKTRCYWEKEHQRNSSLKPSPSFSLPRPRKSKGS